MDFKVGETVHVPAKVLEVYEEVEFEHVHKSGRQKKVMEHKEKSRRTVVKVETAAGQVLLFGADQVRK